MAEPLLAAACVSTDGGPEAVLAGADTTGSHRDLDVSRTATAPGHGQRRDNTAPRHRRASGINMPTAHAFSGNAPVLKKARSLEPQAAIEAKENYRRASVVKTEGTQRKCSEKRGVADVGGRARAAVPRCIGSRIQSSPGT